MIAAVTLGGAAVATAVYLWWRQRRDQDPARLFTPEPQQPDPVPADQPDDAPQAPTAPPEVVQADERVEAVAPTPAPTPQPVEPPAAQQPAPPQPVEPPAAQQPAQPQPVEPLVAQQPAAPVAVRQPVARHAPFGDLDELDDITTSERVEPLVRVRTPSPRRAILRLPPGLPHPPPPRIPSRWIPLPLGRAAAPRIH